MEYAKPNTCTNVQRAFRKQFRTDPLPRASIQTWFDNSEHQECICKKTSSGRRRVSDEAVRQVDATFNRSPRKSAREGSRELQMPSSTQTGSHETLQCHATRPLDWESWSCRWRVDEVASSLSRSHSMWLLSVGLCIGTSVCATSTTGYWWTEVDSYCSVEKVGRNMLERVWDELDYGLDNYRVTNGPHIQHL
jgi:hypothetical protein